MRRYSLLLMLFASLFQFSAVTYGATPALIDLSEYEKTCLAIGFKKRTPAYGKCVTELNKQFSDKQEQAEKAKLDEQRKDQQAAEIRKKEEQRAADIREQEKWRAASIRRDQELKGNAIGKVRLEIVTNKGCNYVEFNSQEKVYDRKQANVSWSGDCDGEFISGSGLLVIKTNEKVQNERATFVNGLENGFVDEVGVWRDGKRWSFSGILRDGIKDGRGEESMTDGSKYIGEYRQDKRNGFGKLITSSGIELSGEFVNGLLTGQGVMQAPAYKYVGEFMNGKLHGEGIIYGANGRTIRATFDRGNLINSSEDSGAENNSYESRISGIEKALSDYFKTLQPGYNGPQDAFKPMRR